MSRYPAFEPVPATSPSARVHAEDEERRGRRAGNALGFCTGCSADAAAAPELHSPRCRVVHPSLCEDENCVVDAEAPPATHHPFCRFRRAFERARRAGGRAA